MKRIIFLVGFLTVIGFSSANAQEQKTNGNVPKNISSAFEKMYPNVRNVKWEMEEGKYEGKFSMQGKSRSVQFNEEAGLVQKEIYLKVSQLPKNVQNYLSKNYAGVQFEKASEVTDAKGVKRYQAETKDKTVMFNAKGIFMKEEKGE